MKQTHTINITLTQDEIEALEKAKNILSDMRNCNNIFDECPYKLIIDINTGVHLVVSDGEVKEAIDLCDWLARAVDIHWEQKEI